MKRSYLNLGAALAVGLFLSMPALSQNNQSAPPAATVMGTVTDANGDVIPNASVVLKEVESDDPLTIVTNGNGMFEFHNVRPGIPYLLNVSAKDRDTGAEQGREEPEIRKQLRIPLLEPELAEREAGADHVIGQQERN